jgi:hypothetical protein
MGAEVRDIDWDDTPRTPEKTQAERIAHINGSWVRSQQIGRLLRQRALGETGRARFILILMAEEIESGAP